MVFPRLGTLILAGVLAVPIALLTGCGDSDDTTDPNGADPGAEIELQTVQQASLAALELVTSMTEDMSDWIDGPPTGRSDPIPWNEAEQRYQWIESIEVGQEPNVITTMGSYWIQFRDAADNPLTGAAGAAVIEMHADWSMAGHFEGDGVVSDLAWEYEATQLVDGLPNGPHGIVGSGSMSGDASTVSASHSESMEFAMAWDADLTLASEGACATGAVTVSMQDYVLTADYNAGQSVAWTLTDAGDFVAAGTSSYACVP